MVVIKFTGTPLVTSAPPAPQPSNFAVRNNNRGVLMIYEAPIPHGPPLAVGIYDFSWVQVQKILILNVPLYY